MSESAKRILVADDNRDWADGLSLVLKDEGYTVRVAYDGREAVEAAREFKPDVVILDVCMPSMTGYEAGRVLARQGVQFRPVMVAVTGRPMESGKLNADFAGFDHYLGKTGGPQPILQLLKQL